MDCSVFERVLMANGELTGYLVVINKVKEIQADSRPGQDESDDNDQLYRLA